MLDLLIILYQIWTAAWGHHSHEHVFFSSLLFVYQLANQIKIYHYLTAQQVLKDYDAQFSVPAFGRGDDGEENTQPSIPHHLVFTYKHNILETGKPKHFYDNIQKTAQKYKVAWNEERDSSTPSFGKGKEDKDVTIYFLDDEACISNIEAAYPDLVPHFHAEQSGAFKADICRLAFLYLHGGYYFDVDVDILEPYIPDPDVTFVTVNDDKMRYLFQAILMTSPRHPIIKRALELELDHYEKGLTPPVNQLLIGCDILKRAFDDFAINNHTAVGPIALLDEINLSHGSGHATMYPHIRRSSWLCNGVVHDPKAQKVYFKSRIDGSSNCPSKVRTRKLEKEFR